MTPPFRYSSRFALNSIPSMRGKVLIAKPGLDGHDRGAKYIARCLRDDGFEVVYTGIRRTPEEIVTSAIHEDVDVIGLSILSGAHMEVFADIFRLLKQQGADEIPIVGGGIIPDADIIALREMGVRAIFTPGSPLKDMLAIFRELAAEARQKRGLPR